MRNYHETPRHVSAMRTLHGESSLGLELLLEFEIVLPTHFLELLFSQRILLNLFVRAVALRRRIWVVRVDNRYHDPQPISRSRPDHLT